MIDKGETKNFHSYFATMESTSIGQSKSNEGDLI